MANKEMIFFLYLFLDSFIYSFISLFYLFIYLFIYWTYRLLYKKRKIKYLGLAKVFVYYITVK